MALKTKKRNPQGEDLVPYMSNEVGRVGYSTPGEKGGMEIVYRRGTTLARALEGIPSGSNIYSVSFDDRKPWRGAWIWDGGVGRKKNTQLLSPTAYQVAAFESVPVSRLDELPTLASGHMHDLKMESDVQDVPTRWWLSRMTREDGEVNAVHVEQLIDGRWQDVYQYGEAVGYEERFENPARPWALVKSVGMDDRLMSTHTTKASAEKAMRKAGGEPDSLFQSGMRIVGVGPDGPYEVIRVQGRGTVRMRNGERATNPGHTRSANDLVRGLKF